MKVTIITSEGVTRFVLKAESPEEILAIKATHGRELIAKHHESTQILEESYPDCLVITPRALKLPEENLKLE